MNPSIYINFGNPHHGWLPVDLSYGDIVIGIEASDVLNDPIEELYLALTEMDNDIAKTITCWEEPGATLFRLEKKDSIYLLTISEISDLHDENEKPELITTISLTKNELINPFRDALIKFSQLTWDNQHWPVYLNTEKVKKLKML